MASAPSPSTLSLVMIVKPVWTLGVTVPAVERGDGHVDAVLADELGLLGDQRLDGALLERLHLVGPGVEADDLHLVALAWPGARRWPCPRR